MFLAIHTGEIIDFKIIQISLFKNIGCPFQLETFFEWLQKVNLLLRDLILNVIQTKSLGRWVGEKCNMLG